MEFLTPTLGLMHALHIAALQSLALLFSALGSEPFYLLLLPLVFWFYDRRIGAQLGVLVLISVFVNDLAKLAVHLPRPYWVEPSLAPHFKAALEPTFGFPSGHAQGAFLVWPFLALRSGNPKKWLPFALGLATLIAFSRMVLGVHWPLDVAGGALIGAGLLLLFVRFGASLEAAFRARPVLVQALLAAVFVGVFGGARRAVFGSRRRCARCLCARLGRRRSLARRAGCGTAWIASRAFCGRRATCRFAAPSRAAPLALRVSLCSTSG